MVFGRAPKLDEGGDELTLVALGADMCQTDNEVVLEEALDDDVAVDAGQVKVDRQHVQHVQSLLLHEVLQDGTQLRLRNVLYPPVLDEFLQHAVEDGLSVERTALYGETADDLVLDDIEEEVELVGLGEELEGDDDHLEVVLLP